MIRTMLNKNFYSISWFDSMYCEKIFKRIITLFQGVYLHRRNLKMHQSKSLIIWKDKLFMRLPPTVIYWLVFATLWIFKRAKASLIGHISLVKLALRSVHCRNVVRVIKCSSRLMFATMSELSIMGTVAAAAQSGVVEYCTLHA